MPQLIKLSEVVTQADANKYLTEQCFSEALHTTLTSIIIGAVAIPLAYHKFKRPIKFHVLSNNYSIVLVAFAYTSTCYYSGVWSKSYCENRIKKELENIKLEK